MKKKRIVMKPEVNNDYYGLEKFLFRKHLLDLVKNYPIEEVSTLTGWKKKTIKKKILTYNKFDK